MVDKLSHIITLAVGDINCNGHCRQGRFQLKSNLPLADIEKAYKLGAAKFGFSWIESVCKNHENEFLLEYLNRLFELGFLAERGIILIEGSLTVPITIDLYLEIVLFLVSLGNENFEYEWLKIKSEAFWDVGGYALYEE